MNFQIVTSVPVTLKPGAIERAIAQFVEDVDTPLIPVDKQGRYNQLLAYVHSCLVAQNNPNNNVWIKEDEDGEVGAFALTSFEIHVDNKLSLWLSAAWVRRSHRFTTKPKEWFHQMEAFGKAAGASHLLIPSVRGTKGYLRFVGQGWHKYEVILKKDL